MLVIDLIHEKINDGYKIFIEQYKDGRTYQLSKRLDETTKTTVAVISAKVAALLVAKFGPSVHGETTEYAGKRKHPVVAGDYILLHINVNQSL